MIGKIKGKLIEIEGNLGLIEVNGGLAFQVFLPPALSSLEKLNQTIEVYTYFYFKEEMVNIFGFENKNQYQLFSLLLKVKDVGPKTAFSIISFTPPEKIFQAIKKNDIDFFVRIPGIGKKTAQRILLELSTKLKTEFQLPKQVLTQEEKTLIDALLTLGFHRFEILQILPKVKKEISLEEKIKQAIKLLTKKKI